MSKDKEILDSIADKEYEHGFVTDVEQEFIPKGLNEDIIRLISAKKGEPEWMLEFRLEAFRRWQKMKLPTWAHLDIPEIDFQDIIYYAAPKKDEDRPKEIDPELEKTFDKLGIPLHERAALAGVAVDAVFHGHMLPCQRNKPQVMYLAGRDTANIGHVLPQVSLPPLWQT